MDGTREALCGLPVRWVGIEESPLLCASLGRQVGAERSKGEHIMFLDGDMELTEEFLSPALSVLADRPDVAGVVGQVFEEDFSSRGGKRDRSRISLEGTAPRFGGAGLFRREFLLRAGGYDPYIFNREENELYSRIRKAGWIVWQLPVPMAVHHDPPATATEKLLREIIPARRRPLGRSQAFLRAMKKGNLLAYCRQEWLFFFSLAADIFTLAGFVLLPGRIAWWGALALQLASLSVHGHAWSARQYLLNKLAALQFLAGLIIAPLLLRTPLPRVSETAP
jgi:cellulose synthase/poly-beta-1,6-N-acetylglucosamine synthase-like glycosyltransferase